MTENKELAVRWSVPAPLRIMILRGVVRNLSDDGTAIDALVLAVSSANPLTGTRRNR